MRKNFFLFIFMILLIMAWLTCPPPVLAQGPAVVYVDTSYTGSESGTQSQPYNTIAEGIANAQAQPGGAFILLKSSDGTWRMDRYIPPIRPGASGGEGGPAAVVTDTSQSPQVTEAATSARVTKTPTSSPDTETPTSPYITETPASPQVTETPVNQSNTETPLANAAVYGLLAILTVGLVLAVYLYQRRFRGH